MVIWDWTSLKDIILWILLIGIPICFNATIDTNKFFFRDLVKKNFKFAILIEFIIGTFTFSIVAELILVPAVSLLFIFYSISKTNEEFKPVEKLLSFLLSTIGFIILFYALKNAIQSYPNLNILELFIVFSLPLTMTFLFLPISYFFALYSEYEILFRNLKFRLPKKKLKKKVLWNILKTCGFSLKKVRYIREKFLAKFYSYMLEEDIDKVIKRF